MNEVNNNQNSTEQAVNYTDLLATGLTNKQIVKKKFKKAWSWKLTDSEYWIMDGELPKDTIYFPFAFSDPMGELIAKGNNVKQAWQNAAQACC